MVLALSPLFSRGVAAALAAGSAALALHAGAPDPALTWLQASRATVQARLTQYDHARYNQVTNQAQTPLDAATVALELAGSRWTVTTQVTPVSGNPAAADFAVTFRCTQGRLPQAALAVDVAFDGWSSANYVLLPSAAYNGNRFPSRRLRYSPKLYEVQDIGKDVPIIITDVPRLNAADGPSRIQERSGSMSVPAVGFRNAANQGFLLMTRQGNALGDYGLGIEETRGRDRAVISVSSPVVRERFSYRICDAQFPSNDEPRDFAAGDEVTLAFRAYQFAAPDVQALFDTLARVRKGLVTDRRPLPNTLPFSACMELAEQKFNQVNFVPAHGYYSVGPRQNFLQDWQIGWTGGMISTYPLLFAGNEATRQNVLRNFDWLFPAGISPSGFFWDSGKDGTVWYGGDIRKPQTKNWHLIRKSGDAVFYILRQFDLMKRLGVTPKPAWEQGTRGVCDAFVRLWDREHQFGQFVDSLSGEITVGGSSGGAIIPAALALAARYYNHPDYLRVARESAEHYYRHFTQAGITCGGPGDALQNPDSESGYALVESYTALHDATGDAVWLDRAQQAARQYASWVVAYDFQFPPTSTFGQTGIRSTGAVYANTQNKHAAPAICTHAGLALLKLFRATQDQFFLELLADTAHSMPQYLPHPTRPLGRAKPGWMCERVNLTDWEGPEFIGETQLMTTWAESGLMLTAIEIPGLYVQTQRGLAVAFDNITAAVVADEAHRLVVEVANPTALPATVRILAESTADLARPLPDNVLYGAPTVTLAPGQRQRLEFPKP
jgi:hypothetical protein